MWLQTHCIKSIIFSQFTQFLDLLEWRLLRGGIRCVLFPSSLGCFFFTFSLPLLHFLFLVTSNTTPTLCLIFFFFFFFRRCVKLDGRMSPANRAAVIEAFNTKPEITVFLISLKV